MRASLRWLNSLLDSPVTLEEAAERLTLAGFPVEHWETTDDGDTALEVELTSNRGDCLSHLGLAREIAATTGRRATDPASDASAAIAEHLARHHGQAASAAKASGLSVTNEDHSACPLYSAHVIRGVRVAPSPDWMQSRLRAIGQVPRNILVDATNYVLFELGQPTHVFDLRTLAGPAIVVRRARAGETLVPIGEGAAPVTLRPTDLVIADAANPVAVAGVKGGAPTAVTETTTDIVVEAATFDPRAVRSASRGLGLASDSSFRFERGVEAAQVGRAAARLVHLILTHAGGTLDGPPHHAGRAIAPPREVTLRVTRCAALLGSDISADDIARFLAPLGLQPRIDGTTVVCRIPPERIDLTREVDLIEEVARLRGLDAVPTRERITIRTHAPEPVVQATRAAKDLLAGLGYLETVTHTLVTERAAASHVASVSGLLRVEDDRALAPILRPSLLASLLEVLATNADRAGERPQLFEVARQFQLAGATHREPVTLAMLHPSSVGERDVASCYRALRGSVERLVRAIIGTSATIEEDSSPAVGYSPSATIRADGRVLGRIGLVGRGALKSAGVDGPVAAAELEFLESVSVFPPEVRVRALPTFPASDRDLSLVVPLSVRWRSIHAHVTSLGLANLETADFVTTFCGSQIGAGRKSVTMRLRFRAPDRTLKREEVDAETARATESLRSALGAEVRA